MSYSPLSTYLFRRPLDDNASLRSASITFDAHRDEQDLLNESFASNPTDETVLMQK
ncbi:hypothetical protein CAEBREN_32479 [Caenorhabditis brenneri]|uniref:Uncharacterized protein n=1 Tax=Caenorhabditis brenneri TaxID=135651 RepID=G0MQU0_CAEBE|nr:hypothetical protein CAEBREN_32479 [Caenorhabditis brenneri]